MSRHLMRATVLLAFAGAVSLAAQSRTPEVQFKAAEQKELVQGDLKGAIQDYERIAKGSDRALAAQALLRIAAIHAKLGDADARKVYERIARDFADQPQAAATARARIGVSAPVAKAARTRRQIPLAPVMAEWEVGVSADGRYISGTGEDGELVIVDLTTGRPRTVTGATDLRTAFSAGAFSRDGKQIAFNVVGGPGPLPQGELRIIDLQERGIPASRKVSSEGILVPFGWTPDGKAIAVVGFRSAADVEIGMVSTADGTYRTLRPFTALPRGAALSPDGKFVAVAVFEDAPSSFRRDVLVIAVADGRVTRVEHPADDDVIGWSPDSRYVVFTSDRNTESPTLYAQSFANGQPQGVPTVLERNWGRVESLGITDSGALFYRPSTESDSTTDIKVATFDFERMVPAVSPKVVREERPGSVNLPAWSADGKSLAYRLTRPGRAARIVVRSMETDASRELPTPGNLNSLAWHPDGKSLIAVQGAGTNTAAVMQIDIATGQATRLAPGVNAKPSPDGATVYIRRARRVQAGGLEEVTMVARSLASGTERELIRRPLGSGFWVSPDGRYIGAHVRAASESDRMVLIPTDGAPVREIPLPRTGLGGLTWTPDGQSLLFGVGDSNEVWQVRLDGRATKLAVDLPNRRPSPWALNPDGRQVAFTGVASVGQQDTGLWVLENFLSALDAK